MSLVCQHTLVSMSCPNRLSKPSSLANFQAMSSNQCLELLVCSYYKKKKILWSHWSQPVFSIYTTIYRGEKAVFKVLNNKKWDYRVAKWQQFRVNRGSLRTEPKETGNSTRQGNSSPGTQCGLQLRRASGKTDLPEVVAAPEQFTQKLWVLVVFKASARHSHSQSGVGDGLALEGWVTSRAASCSTSLVLWTVRGSLWEATQEIRLKACNSSVQPGDWQIY